MVAQHDIDYDNDRTSPTHGLNHSTTPVDDDDNDDNHHDRSDYDGHHCTADHDHDGSAVHRVLHHHLRSDHRWDNHQPCDPGNAAGNHDDDGPSDHNHNDDGPDHDDDGRADHNHNNIDHHNHDIRSSGGLTHGWDRRPDAGQGCGPH